MKTAGVPDVWDRCIWKNEVGDYERGVVGGV